LWLYPLPEFRADNFSNFVHSKVFANSVPDHPARLATDASRRASSCQKGNGVLEPYELHQRARISAWVFLPPTDASEAGAICPAVHQKHPPPIGHDFDCLNEVAMPNDYGRTVHHPAIHVNLAGQATQAVSIRFDLEPVEGTIHKGQINSHLSAAESEFLNDHSSNLGCACG
jgi:hypothetical protein